MHRWFLAIMLVAGRLEAQSLSRLDSNQDGVLRGLAYGDSITLGVGDSGVGGYPARLSTLLGLPIENVGIAGEKLMENGLARAPGTLVSSSADFVIFMEGANDAIVRGSSGEYERELQQFVNVVRVLGKEPVVLTLPPPCCEHLGLALFTDAYSSVVKSLVGVNSLIYADLQRAWQTTCNSSPCQLYNLPEGLHPNGSGYDVIAQTIAASILDVDIFAPDGALQLESAVGLAPGTVLVKPDLAAVQP